MALIGPQIVIVTMDTTSIIMESLLTLVNCVPQPSNGRCQLLYTCLESSHLCLHSGDGGCCTIHFHLDCLHISINMITGFRDQIRQMITKPLIGDMGRPDLLVSTVENG